MVANNLRRGGQLTMADIADESKKFGNVLIRSEVVTKREWSRVEELDASKVR